MMEDVKNKCCPFLVVSEKTHFKYTQAEVTIEKFNDCLGEKCAAYYQGGCLRLGRSVGELGNGLDVAEYEQLKEDLMRDGFCVTEGPTFVNPDDPDALAMVEALTAQMESGDSGQAKLESPVRIGFNNHDCETRYSCPYCKKPFGDWDIYHQEKRNGSNNYCPHCKKEFKERGRLRNEKSIDRPDR